MKTILKSIIIFFLSATFAQAATLYFDAPQDIYRGDVFILELKIESEEEINAIQVEIVYPQDKLEVKDFGKGGSVFTFWPEEPQYGNGIISFTAGVPKGFRGQGRIALIPFLAVLEGSADLFFQNSLVLLNDGLGTESSLASYNLSIDILEEKDKTDLWLKELLEDKTPPEPFEIFLGQDKSVFDGQYFIAFSTNDNQSGIDYYEIREGNMDWQRGQSPYLLQDQSLAGKILVKAVDKAGNERIASYRAKKPNFLWLIVVIVLVFVLVKKLKSKL